MFSKTTFPDSELVYDYYAYPQLYGRDYGQDDCANGADCMATKVHGDDTDEFIIPHNNAEISKHVTYVPNGAVISNVPTVSSVVDALIVEAEETDDIGHVANIKNEVMKLS